MILRKGVLMNLSIFRKKQKSTLKGGKVLEKKQSLYYNKEAYPDPTAYYGMKNAMKEEEKLEIEANRLVHIIKSICDVAGFEIVGRITLKHKKSGKEFR